MSRKRIIIATIIILALPIIASLILLLFNNQTIIDKDFWYGYMQFAGAVLLAGFALYQTQKNIDDNEISQKMIEEFQKDLVDANERANTFAHYVYNNDKRNCKACMIPNLFLHQHEENKRYYFHIRKSLPSNNVGNDFAILKRTIFMCGDYTNISEEYNTFIGNHDSFNDMSFDICPQKDQNRFTLYLLMKNKKGKQPAPIIYSDFSLSSLLNKSTKK